MSGIVNKPAYKRMLDEDIQWLSSQSRSLERDHIQMILEQELRDFVLYEESIERHLQGER